MKIVNSLETRLGTEGSRELLVEGRNVDGGKRSERKVKRG